MGGFTCAGPAPSCCMSLAWLCCPGVLCMQLAEALAPVLGPSAAAG